MLDGSFGRERHRDSWRRRPATIPAELLIQEIIMGDPVEQRHDRGVVAYRRRDRPMAAARS